MSDFPPPGAPPPGPPPPGAPPPGGPSGPPAPGWGQPEPGWQGTVGPSYPPGAGPPGPGYRPPPGMLGAAHKPGAMPLKPLGLGEIYDAAFRIIRFNPKATVGSAVLVSVVAMLIPVVVTAALTFTIGTTYDATGTDPNSTDDLIGTLGASGTLVIGAVLQGFGLLLVTGMIAHVTAAAAVGRRLDLGQAWAATHGKRWRLIGLALLLGLATALLIGAYIVLLVVGIVVLEDNLALAILFGFGISIVFAAGFFWFWIRVYYLPVPALMLEPVGVIGSIGRGFALTRQQFWRTFGIGLLTFLIAAIAGQILSVPVAFIGQIGVLAVDPEYALLLLVATQAVSTVLASAFTTPFTSSVTSVQYLDQRMRKEAYDVELMTQAGITQR